MTTLNRLVNIFKFTVIWLLCGLLFVGYHVFNGKITDNVSIGLVTTMTLCYVIIYINFIYFLWPDIIILIMPSFMLIFHIALIFEVWSRNPENNVINFK